MAGRKRPLEQLPVVLGAVTALIGAVTAFILAWHSLFPASDRGERKAASQQSSSRGVQADPPQEQVQNVIGAIPEASERAPLVTTSERQRTSESHRTPTAPIAPPRRVHGESASGTESLPQEVWRRAVVSSTRIEIYLRRSPSEDAPVLRRVTPKDVLHINGPKDGWWLAQLPSGERGYVKDDGFITIIEDQASPR